MIKPWEPNYPGPHRWEVIGDIIENNFLTIGAELGVENGENILYLKNRFPNLYIIGVENFSDKPSLKRFKQNEENIKKCLNKFYVIDTIEASKLLKNESLDYVFIDADHTYNGVKQDIIHWEPKVRKGGFIIGHDYGHPKYTGVNKAVNEFYSDFNVAPDCVWYRKKI